MHFVPVPLDALDLLPREDWAAVTDLYKRAFEKWWAPFCVTDRSLATAWGCSRRRVWEILDALEAAGLVAIDRGARRKPTLITVGKPTSQQPSQQPSQNYRRSPNAWPKPAPSGEPMGEPLLERLQTKTKTDPPMSPPPGGIDKLVKVMVGQLDANGDEGWDPNDHATVMRAAGWCKNHGYPARKTWVEQAMRQALAQHRGEA
jgi:hypothetical protein